MLQSYSLAVPHAYFMFKDVDENTTKTPQGDNRHKLVFTRDGANLELTFTLSVT